MSTLVRNCHIAEQIVFVDGISGSGKSILGPILASFDRVERYRLESIYEYISRIHFLKKIETDAAVALLKIYSDEALYKLSISREVNFRPKDNTGFLNAVHKWEAIKRLFLKDGEAAIQRIQTQKPILQTNTHEMFSAIDLAFLAFGERLTVFEMMRHPVFLIPHWVSCVESYGTDPRDLTLWLDAGMNRAVPWYAIGWENEYFKLSPMDKSIRVIAMLYKGILEAYSKLNSMQQEQVLLIPFEDFVLCPDPYLIRIEKRLQTTRTTHTQNALNRQKVPRQVLTDGRGHAHHAWKAPGKNATNSSEYEKILDSVEKQASPNCRALLLEISQDYEKQFGISAL